MDELDLDAIEERANAAKPGPWHYLHGYGFDWHPSGDGPSTPNVVFACRAREDVPALVAEVRRLRAEVERARKKADDYERDWYIAKSEFGDARAKLRANIEAARAEEREACARICDDEAARVPDRHLSAVAADLADRIRARGDQ